MRVLHCCLANFYVDNYSYQENVFPRMHRLQGHDVAILASTETYIDNKVLGHTQPRSYHTEDGIPITRLDYARRVPLRIARRFRIYQDLYPAVASFAPDILFLHDCQFLSIHEIARYAKEHPGTTIYVDSHTDLGNTGRNWLSRNVLHRGIFRQCAQVIEPYTSMFYGTLPSRVDFYRTIYGIPAEKLALLPLGAEDTKVDWERKDEIRAELRAAMGVQESDFLVISGGKIDRRKNIHGLMRSIQELDQQDIKLVVFGTPDSDMESDFAALSTHDRIKCVGWVSSDQVYDYLLASDLAVFPGSHSVLWEQAVGVGLPCVFKRWPGVHHLDVGGNCRFLSDGSVAELKQVILDIRQDPTLYSKMSRVAMSEGRREFSYSEIAKRALGG